MQSRNSMDRFSPYLLICLLGFLVYGQSIFFDFTYCDDYKIIVEEHHEIEDFSKITQVFESSFGSLYRPVLQATWIVDAAVSGKEPLAYHISNLIIHLIASCLAYLFLLRLTLEKPQAMIFAMIFTVHPVLVEAVAWVPGRNDSLVTLFVLASFLAFLRLMKKSHLLWWTLHFLFFALALFTKEPAALFPLLCILYMAFHYREKLVSAPAAILLSGWLITGLFWIFLRRAALAATSSPDLVGFEAFVKNLPALPALLGKSILPLRLSGLATFDTFSLILGFAVFALLAGAFLWLKGWKSRNVLFGLSWFLLFLLPSLFFRVHTADDHYDYLEHRAYLPLAGLLLVFIALLQSRGITFSSKKTLCAALLLITLFTGRSFLYCRTYSDPFTFWTQALEKDPSRSNFHSVLGKLHYEEGDLKKAEAHFLKATELSLRNDPLNYKNLGVIYRDLEELEKSSAMYEKALAADPDNADLHHYLGKAYYDGGKLEAAEKHLLRARLLDPDRTDSLIVLVGVYFQQKRMDEAMEACRQVLVLDPKHFHACNILGSLHANRGEMEEAAGMWIKITLIQPDHLPAYECLMNYHLKKENLQMASYYAGELIKRGGQVSPEKREKLKIP